MTNEELAVLARQGDVQALERLYMQNKRIIGKVCNKFTRDPLLLQDLEQEAYFGLVQAVGAYNEARGYKFITYLTKGVEWHLTRYLKRHNFPNEKLTLNAPVAGEDNDAERVELLQDDSVNIERDITEAIYGSEIVRAVLALDTSGLLRLRYIENMSCDDIAELEGCSYGEASRRIYNALRKVRTNGNFIRLCDDRVYSMGLRGTGFTAWYRTGTSSTEYAAMKLLEMRGDEIGE